MERKGNEATAHEQAAIADTTIQISPSELVAAHSLCNCGHKDRSLLTRSKFYNKYKVPCIHSLHDPHLISGWLRGIGMEAYISQFETAQVAPATLLSLTSAELRDMGIKRLADRRIILEEVYRQRLEPLPRHLSKSTTEHGRILNHLANERLLLLRLRVILVLLIAAVAAVRLRKKDMSENGKFIKGSAQFLASLAIAFVLYAYYRFIAIKDVSDHPTKYALDNKRTVITPFGLAFIITSVTLYAVMAQKSSEIAIIGAVLL